MNLEQIQRSMFTAIRQPLTAEEQMRHTVLSRETANSIVKPNDRLTSFERLEIYNRQYWFRIISALADDFDGLRAILGERQFHRLATAYLSHVPSRSYTMRNLGSQLAQWLEDHPDFFPDIHQIAVAMARLEWAEIEAFDAESLPVVSVEELSDLGDDPVLMLQPYITLLELDYPVHNFLLRIRERKADRIRRRPARFLPACQTTFLAVHRIDNAVYFKEMTSEGFAVARALHSGAPLSEALLAADWRQRSPEEISAEVQALFTNWASLGWFCKQQ